MRRFFLTCVVLATLVITAEAHPNLQNVMWVQFEPKAIRVAVNVSLKELSVTSGASFSEGLSLQDPVLDEAARRHRDYLLQHLSLSTGPDVLNGKVVRLVPPPKMADPEQTYFQYELEYSWKGEPTAEVVFSHDMLKEWPYEPGVAWDVSYVVRTKRTDSDEVTSWLLRYHQPSALLTGWGKSALGK